MAVYAISDLHLSLATDKNMNVFGGEWENYEEKMKSNWESTVKKEDSVIIPGDISWAKSLVESYSDFEYLNRLPGTKLISKGNHDYWWTTRKKMEDFCKENGFHTIRFVHNNCVIAENLAICGTRGWMIESPGLRYTEHDQKIFKREIQRLKCSLEAAKQLPLQEKNSVEGGNIAQRKIVVMMHYSPFDIAAKPSAFIPVMREYGVSLCIYGHLHADRIKSAVTGVLGGVEYRLVSADALKFYPVKIG